MTQIVSCCCCTQNVFLTRMNLFAWATELWVAFINMLNLPWTAPSHAGGLDQSKTIWSWKKVSVPLTESGMFTKFCVTTAVWCVHENDKRVYVNHMATMKYSAVRMSPCHTCGWSYCSELVFGFVFRFLRYNSDVVCLTKQLFDPRESAWKCFAQREGMCSSPGMLLLRIVNRWNYFFISESCKRRTLEILSIQLL